MIKILTLICLMAFSCTKPAAIITEPKVYEVFTNDGKHYIVENFRSYLGDGVARTQYTDKLIKFYGSYTVIEYVPPINRP